MAYRIAADLVMAVHFIFVLFVLLGGVLVWRWPRVAWWHVPAFAWGLWVAAARKICPLTPLEQNLRIASGEVGFDGSFISYYVEPLLYPSGLRYTQKMFFAALLVILNAALYWHAWSRRKST